MVRTKADGACSSGSRKAVGGNAPRKSLGGAGPSTSSSSPSGTNNKYGGGNPVCPRPTPNWQKGIGMFLSQGATSDKENSEPSTHVEITGATEAAGSTGEGKAECSSDR